MIFPRFVIPKLDSVGGRQRDLTSVALRTVWLRQKRIDALRRFPSQIRF
jgi:hypothetical protein